VDLCDREEVAKVRELIRQGVESVNGQSPDNSGIVRVILDDPSLSRRERIEALRALRPPSVNIQINYVTGATAHLEVKN
tara:strand:+ start:419 stop:655 length:237 start_codon:yes stop_codon:yes gene_type:complete